MAAFAKRLPVVVEKPKREGRPTGFLENLDRPFGDVDHNKSTKAIGTNVFAAVITAPGTSAPFKDENIKMASRNI